MKLYQQEEKKPTTTNITVIKLNKATRSAANWKVKPPGSLDSVNARHLFASNNAFGIPMLADNSTLFTTTSTAAAADTELMNQQPPARLVPYRTRIGSEESTKQSFLASTGVHFFIEDYQAEAVWKRPRQSLGAVRHFGTVLSPDFSLYRDWPPAIQIWNTYRSRWCAAWWQSHGLRVVPSVAWAGPSSYSFCFLGIPKGSVVAVSTVGLGRDKEAWRFFRLGFETMLERINPTLVLCHGAGLPTESHRQAEEIGCVVKEYEPFWVGSGSHRCRSGFGSGVEIEADQQEAYPDGR